MKTLKSELDKILDLKHTADKTGAFCLDCQLVNSLVSLFLTTMREILKSERPNLNKCTERCARLNLTGHLCYHEIENEKIEDILKKIEEVCK